MNNIFFELSIEEQVKSLTFSAHGILKEYGLIDAEIKSINYEFNATFSVVTQSAEQFALRININSTRTLENMLAEIEWVNFLARIPGITVPRPVANQSNEFITVSLHEDSGRTLKAVLYTWLDGEEVGDDAVPEQMFQVGMAMATLHRSSKDFTLTAPAIHASSIYLLPFARPLSSIIFSDIFFGTS